MADRPFDETLYRLVEGEDAARGAAELKARLDRDPQFAASFEQTRKTVISLQGLAPRPAEPRTGTFTQRDFERLTRDVLKGYKSKLAELYFQLGSAYLFEAPQERMAWTPSVPPPSSDSTEARLSKAKESFKAVGGLESSSLAGDEKKLIFDSNEDLSESDEAGRAGRSFFVSRVLRPRYSLAWSRGALATLRRGDLRSAASLQLTAENLAQTREERNAAASVRTAVFYFSQQYGAMLSFLREYLSTDPLSIQGQYNSAVALWKLGNFQEAAERFARVFARAASSPDVQRAIEAGLKTGDWSTWRRMNPEAHGRIVDAAMAYLGREAVSQVGGVL